VQKKILRLVSAPAPLPCGVIFEPFNVKLQTISAPLHEPLECHACRARASNACETKPGEWRCLFCAEWNPLGIGVDPSSLVVCDAVVGHGSTSLKHVVLVLDEAGLTRDVVDGVVAALAQCPDDVHASMVVFSSCAWVFELGGSGFAVATECLNGLQRPDAEVAAVLREHETSEEYAVKFVTPLHLARDGIARALEHYLQPRFGDAAAPRCLGVAVETAVLLLDVVGAPCGTVVVLTSGAPTLGPGAIAHTEGLVGELKREAEANNALAEDLYKDIRAQCASSRVGVDVFCVGDRTEAWAVQQLCELGRLSLRVNDASLLASMMREPPGTITLRLSGAQQPRLAFEPLEDFVEDAVTLLLKPETQQRVVQLTLRSTATRLGLAGMGEVERTVTRVLAPNEVADDRLVAVLAGKEALALGRGEAHLTAVLRALAGPHRESKRVPATVVRVASMMFHMARGPMFRGHPEEMHATRARFVHAGLESAARLMMPQLFALRWSRGLPVKAAALTPVPPSSLALRADYVLVLDHELDVFVWFGGDVPPLADERKVALDFARALAFDGRWPVPPVMAFEERDSFARCVRARLSPEHKDSPEAQLSSHGLLAELSPDQLAKFRARLFAEYSDDECFSQWFARCF